MATRATIIVAGPQIQKVGYRDKVQEIARELKIKGSVQNLKDGSVEIICEVEEKIIDEFVGRLKIAEDYIKVESVNVVNKIEAKGEFEYFEIKYGDITEEFGERAVALMIYMKGLGKGVKQVGQSINSMHVDVNNRFGTMAGKYDEINTSLKDIKNEFKKLVNHFTQNQSP